MAVFFLGLFLLFGLEVAGGLLAFLKKNELYGTVKENIHKAVTHMYGGEDSLSKTFTKTMDKLQQEMKCCGFNSTTNWKDSSWYRNRADKKMITPKSCCKNQKASNCGKADSVNFEKGCIQAFNDIINGNVGINGLGGAAIGLGGSQIIGLVLTGWLYRAFGVHRGGHTMLTPGIV
ncbi:CD151 antigen-like isoform X2 [Rhopilema esculentum]